MLKQDQPCFFFGILQMKPVPMPADATHLISLFENATEGIILTNGTGNIVLVNPAAERMFGYTADELINKPIEVLIPDKVKPHHHALREGFYNKPSNRVMGQGRDLYGKRKDGSGVALEVSLSFYKRQEELFVIAFIVDITLRKKSEQNILDQQKELEEMTSDMRKLNTQLETKVEERTLILKEALQKLEESQKDLNEALDKEKQLNEIKSRFVSMASHEFRTPLSTVLSSASLLSKYITTEDQDKRDRHVEKIRNSVKHLNDILEDFLSLGKLDEGKVASYHVEFDIKEFMHDVVDEMRGLMKRGQQIVYEHEGYTQVYTDKKLLKNIIINLAANAIKFSEEDQSIVVKSRINGKRMEISIADKGIGIPEQDRAHLFSSFFRGKNVINIPGTGLGLHIVKRYLELLGGAITVDSKIGEGSTFCITIPVTNHTS
jgi:PAS domain S-box-containing protein